MEFLCSSATLRPPSVAQLNCAEELYLKIDSPKPDFPAAVLPHVRKTCGSVAVKLLMRVISKPLSLVEIT